MSVTVLVCTYIHTYLHAWIHTTYIHTCIPTSTYISTHKYIRYECFFCCCCRGVLYLTLLREGVFLFAVSSGRKGCSAKTSAVLFFWLGLRFAVLPGRAVLSLAGLAELQLQIRTAKKPPTAKKKKRSHMHTYVHTYTHTHTGLTHTNITNIQTLLHESDIC